MCFNVPIKHLDIRVTGKTGTRGRLGPPAPLRFWQLSISGSRFRRKYRHVAFSRLITHWPRLAHIVYRHPGTIGPPFPWIGIHPYIYNSDNPGTNTDITGVDTSPHGVEIPTPHRPVSHWLWGSYIEPAPPWARIGSHPRSRGRSIYLKLRPTGEGNREESRVFPDQHRPARSGNPNPVG